MIEDGIACFRVAQQFDERDVIGPRTRQSANDKVEIRGRKPLPTIRANHRDSRLASEMPLGKLRVRRKNPTRHRIGLRKEVTWSVWNREGFDPW